jgi:hypothetical protein
MLNKWQSWYLRDLQPFVSTLTLAYCKGALNKADPSSRRQDFVPHATVPLFRDGGVPLDAELRRKSHPLLRDAQLNSMIVNTLRLSTEFAHLIREGYPRDSFYGDESEWTKDTLIVTIAGYFWRVNRLCVPRNSEHRLILIFEMQVSSAAGHIRVARTLA